MAKLSKSITFKNAKIEISENIIDSTITEFNKDDVMVCNLMDVLRDFDNIEGISLSMKQEDVLTPIED